MTPRDFEFAALPRAQAEVLAKISDLLSRKRARGYLVGGLVRDYLKGCPSDDIDIAVAGLEPEAVAVSLARYPGFSRPVLFPRFKTVMTTGRGLKVEVCRLEGDVRSDALRRDFTVNCLYVDLVRSRSGASRILDPSGSGRVDLRARLLRTPGDPLDALWLDPLRMLRAIRFFATDRFRLSSELASAIERMAYLLTRVSRERIRGEIESILLSSRLESSITLMARSGILSVILPELEATAGFEQKTPYHAYDLLSHLVKTAARTPRRLDLRLAGLLHDVGKTAVQTPKGGRMVYYGHEAASAQVAASTLRRLRFPNRMVRRVEFLVSNHMINYSREWSDRAVRRFARKMGANLPDILNLAVADRRAQRPGASADVLLKDLIVRLRRRDVSPPGPLIPVDGRDIMAILGLREGPAVGEAKEYLIREAIERGRPLSRTEAIADLRRWREIAAASNARSIGVDKAGRA